MGRKDVIWTVCIFILVMEGAEVCVGAGVGVGMVWASVCKAAFPYTSQPPPLLTTTAWPHSGCAFTRSRGRLTSSSGTHSTTHRCVCVSVVVCVNAAFGVYDRLRIGVVENLSDFTTTSNFTITANAGLLVLDVRGVQHPGVPHTAAGGIHRRRMVGEVQDNRGLWINLLRWVGSDDLGVVPRCVVNPNSRFEWTHARRALT